MARQQLPGYFSSQEHSVMVDGDKISTVAKKNDRLTLQRVASVAMPDFFQVFINEGVGTNDQATIAGIEGLHFGTVVIPHNTSWSSFVDFGFNEEVHPHRSFDLLAVKAVRLGVHPNLNSMASRELGAELDADGTVDTHDFLPIDTNGETSRILWTPYELHEDPLVLASLIIQMHQSLD